MLEPWNDCSVLPPPVHTFRCDRFTQIDVKGLKHSCSYIRKVLSKQSPLHKENALMSRFIYKLDKKFRNDIGFRNFKKVNTALRKYLKLNFLHDVENFISVLPSDHDGGCYLPTKQMLEYILVRLLTFAKLLMRIYICSKQAAIFYLDRVKRGESHWMSLMPYALLSRVWSMTMVLLEHSCSWYSNLYKYLDKLELKGLKFLPDKYELPLSLEEWLDLKIVDDFGRFEWSQKKYEVIKNIFDDTEEDTFLLKFVNEINNEGDQEEQIELNQILKKVECEPLVVMPEENIDQGEVINRDDFLSKSTVIQKQPNHGYNKHSIQFVTNKHTLKEFISAEETLRIESPSHSLTSHLTFMQWEALKKALFNLYNSLSNNRKIERKFKKIWKEKCIDYV